MPVAIRRKLLWGEIMSDEVKLCMHEIMNDVTRGTHRAAVLACAYPSIAIISCVCVCVCVGRRGATVPRRAREVPYRGRVQEEGVRVSPHDCAHGSHQRHQLEGLVGSRGGPSRPLSQVRLPGLLVAR